MKFLRSITFPFAMIFWLIIVIRNFLYNIKVFKSKTFDVATICVGNISVGGTGKTPTVEYLIRLLKDEHKIATLSRGYGRKTKGYIEASALSSTDEIGDEPTQFKQKFNEITVTVCEDRATALDILEKDYDAVLLDDAFQHRKVKCGVSVLLFDYNKVFDVDWMLPFGNLREPRSGMKRADVILITKTPRIFSPMERRRVENKLDVYPHQKIFYSYFQYGELQPLNPIISPKKFEDLDKKTKVFILTGIADPSVMINYFESNKIKHIHRIHYPDHYRFSLKDIDKIRREFGAVQTENKIIITTEKDAMRLRHPRLENMIKDIPIYYLPIELHMHDKDKEEFDKIILSYVGSGHKHYAVS
jgi:tetraacyldisaccharide 4'-kinase